MAKLTKAVFYMEEPMKGRFVGYANMDFYHRGYAPYFEKEVADSIMEDYVTAYEDYIDENGVVIAFDVYHDCYVHTDPNGDIAEAWIGEDIETEDGIKHLYAFGEEWMWQAEEEETE